MINHFYKAWNAKTRAKHKSRVIALILGFRSIIRESGFNYIITDFERVDWLKCYWVKLNRYKKILSKSFRGVAQFG